MPCLIRDITSPKNPDSSPINHTFFSIHLFNLIVLFYYLCPLSPSLIIYTTLTFIYISNSSPWERRPPVDPRAVVTYCRTQPLSTPSPVSNMNKPFNSDTNLFVSSQFGIISGPWVRFAEVRESLASRRIGMASPTKTSEESNRCITITAITFLEHY